MATPDLFGQATRALEQGRGVDATTLLVRALKRPGLSRDEQMQIRCALAEAWLLQDDIRQATEALGRPPEARGATRVVRDGAEEAARQVVDLLAERRLLKGSN